jgi:hypothetical protein
VYVPAPEGQNAEGLFDIEELGKDWLVTYAGEGAVELRDDFTEADGDKLSSLGMFDLFVPGAVTLAFEGAAPGEVAVTAHYMSEGSPVPVAEYKIKVYEDLSLELIESSTEAQAEKIMQLHLHAPIPEDRIKEAKAINKDFLGTWFISYSETGILEKTDRFTSSDGEFINDLEEHGIILPGNQTFAFNGLREGETEVSVSYADISSQDEPLVTALFQVRVYEDLTLELIDSALDTHIAEPSKIFTIMEEAPIFALLTENNLEYVWEVSLSKEGILLEAFPQELSEDGGVLLAYEGQTPGYAEISVSFSNGDEVALLRVYTVKVYGDLSVKLLNVEDR